VETPLFDPSGGNVSNEDIHQLIYPRSRTKVFVNMLLGYCTPPDGSSSPTVPRCNDNVMTNYTSDNTATVDAELRDMVRRGIDGMVMDWYGGGSPVNDTTLKFQSEIEHLGLCAGPQRCKVMYLLMYDGSTLKWPVTATGAPGTTGDACPPGPSAADEESCIVARMKNDLCYMNGYHFGSDAYQKYDLNGTGLRPIVQFFIDEGHMFPNLPVTGPAPSWADIWGQLRTWSNDLSSSCGIAPYNAHNGSPLFIFENTPGFTHTASDGAFDWVNPSNDQDNLEIAPASTAGTVDNFYAVSKQYASSKLVWGVAYKGFNDTQSAWGANRLIDQRCGQTWLQSLASAGSYFSAGHQLPFLQVATWNDYNEGTPIETGISNCYRIAAAVQGNTLRWTLSSSSPFASRTTIARFLVFDSADGVTFHQVASLPRQVSSFAVDDLGAGAHHLFVKMVGEAGILNQSSAILTYTGRS
jgi:hypothetical protein